MSFLEQLWDILGVSLAAFLVRSNAAITAVFGSANARQVAKLPEARRSDHRARAEVRGDERRGAATADRRSSQAAARRRDAGRHPRTMRLRFVVREASGSSAMRHYDVQLIGGMVLHFGGIAEMVTGEGKTLVATLPAYLNALEGKGVHVVTVNDYLARRDMEWMAPLYMNLGSDRQRDPIGHVDRRETSRLHVRHHLRHEQRIRL